MNLIPRTPFDFDNIFDSFGRHLQPVGSMDSSFMPRVDIKEKKDRLEVTAELPGVKKEDVELTLENGMLTLSAESHQEDKEEKDGKVIRQERRYGKYIRTFDVGNGVTDKDIEASFKDGILKLHVPLAKSRQPEARRISIN